MFARSIRAVPSGKGATMTEEQLQPAVRNGAPVWIELLTHDPQGATSFYGELFGWDFQDQGEAFGHYNLVIGPDGPLAGAMTSMMTMDGPTTEPQGPTAWTVYLATDDIDAVAAKAPAAGGSVLSPAMAVPNFGSMGLLASPSGAAVGLWQPGPFTGFKVTMKYSTPVWFEELSTDFDADLDFYKQVFGWDIDDMSEPGSPRYVTNGKDQNAVCGLCDAQSFNPPIDSHWRVYFAVSDCDKACARVQELGGTVQDGPMGSPYGSVASVTDPQGARFQLNQVPSR